GLTAIGAAAEVKPSEPPNIVALVSVGGVTSSQLRLLLHRIGGTFPRSDIMVGYWGAAPAQPEAEEERIYYADSATSLVDQVARTADEISHSENGKSVNGGSARRLEVVAP